MRQTRPPKTAPARSAKEACTKQNSNEQNTTTTLASNTGTWQKDEIIKELTTYCQKEIQSSNNEMRKEINQTREEINQLKSETNKSFKNMTTKMDEMRKETKPIIQAVKLDQNETFESFIDVQKQILERLNINQHPANSSSGTATPFDPNSSCTIARQSAATKR
jgi:uncharacterized phage infection (PIP) family protein YhgE